MTLPDGALVRSRLEAARLMLLFTPSVCRQGTEPLQVLAHALPWVDVIQVRIKDADPAVVTPARELHDWAARVLELVAASEHPEVPVLVNDRVDVAAGLATRGLSGVHLGADDCPPAEARRLLGPEPLIGLSTHDARQVAAAEDEPVDYLGFGPIHATPTKGYTTGLGPEAAWVAATASARPVFPIGGIDLTNASELTAVGRAAVSAAVLAAPDPARAAASLRAQLFED